VCFLNFGIFLNFRHQHPPETNDEETEAETSQQAPETSTRDTRSSPDHSTDTTTDASSSSSSGVNKHYTSPLESSGASRGGVRLPLNADYSSISQLMAEQGRRCDSWSHLHLPQEIIGGKQQAMEVVSLAVSDGCVVVCVAVDGGGKGKGRRQHRVYLKRVEEDREFWEEVKMGAEGVAMNGKGVGV